MKTAAELTLGLFFFGCLIGMFVLPKGDLLTFCL